MHAIVVRVTVSDREAAEGMLKKQIVPNISQSPGFVAGYWTNPGGDQGAAMIVFESEEAATNVAEMIRQAPNEHVTFDSVEIAEVTAHA